MKKLGLLIMPLMAISFLANCGGNSPTPTEDIKFSATPSVTLDESKTIANINLDWTPIDHSVECSDFTFTLVTQSSITSTIVAGEPSSRPLSLTITFAAPLSADDKGNLKFHYNDKTAKKEGEGKVEGINVKLPDPPGPTTYALTVNCTNCTASGNKEKYEEGAEVSFTITPDDTYVLPDGIIVTGVTKYEYKITSGVATFACTMPAKAVSVTVTATKPAPSKYNLTVICNNCTPSGNETSYEEGANVSFTITPEDTYVLPNKEDIKVTGVTKFNYTIADSGIATFTCTMPAKAVSVEVIAIAQYILTLTLTNCNVDGSPTYSKTYTEGQTIEPVTVTPNAGFALTDDSIDPNYKKYWTASTSGSYTLSNLVMNDKYTIAINAIAQYTLTLTLTNCNVGGSPTYSKTYTKGQKIESVTVTPNTDYVLTDDSIDPNYKEYWTASTSGSYTLSNLVMNGDYTIAITAIESKLVGTVIWKNYDDKVLETDINVPVGTRPSYDGPTPTHPKTTEYVYLFSGWDPEIHDVVKGDNIYKAVYEQIPITDLVPEFKLVIPNTNANTFTFVCDGSEKLIVDWGDGTIDINNSHTYKTGGTYTVRIYRDDLTTISVTDDASKSYITEIKFKDNITSIADNAFSSCPNLTSINISKNVTSIGVRAFLNCSSLKTVTFGEESQLKSIGESAFNGCSSLTGITIPSSVTLIADQAFYSCSSLTSVDIPDGVTSIGNSTFDSCSNLKTINFGVKSKLKSIGESAFNGCSSLSGITIPSGVTLIADQAFYSCSSLTSVDIPDGVTSIGNSTFDSCSNLKTINFGVKSKLKSIGDRAFDDCASLLTIEIPDSVISVGYRAFDGCVSLEYTIYGNCKYLRSKNGNQYFLLVGMIDYDITSVTIHDSCRILCGAAFWHYGGYSITIPSKVISIGKSAFEESVGLEIVNINSDSELVSIGDGAFTACALLTSITIPNKVTSIGDNAFLGCALLTSITIPSSVTSIGAGVFDACIFLEIIRVDPANTAYTSQDTHGNECNAIMTKDGKTLVAGCATTTIPNGVTSIADYAFCLSSCISIAIPNSVTSIGEGAFRGCLLLDSITIPNSVASIGDYAFNGCSSIVSVTIPSSVTSIGLYAFSGCSSLVSLAVDSANTVYTSQDKDGNECNAIIIKDSKTLIFGCATTTIPDGVTSIGNYAFDSYEGLLSITIPNSVTSIGDYAFNSCVSLTSIIIPNSVTSIGESAFEDCSELQIVDLTAFTEEDINKIPNLGTDAFYDCDESLVIKVANAKMAEIFKGKDGWKDYASKIQPVA